MVKVVQGCQGKHSRSRLYGGHSLARELYLSDTSGIAVSYWLLPFLDRCVSGIGVIPHEKSRLQKSKNGSRIVVVFVVQRIQ